MWKRLGFRIICRWGQTGRGALPLPEGKQKSYAPGEVPAPLVYVVTPGFMRAMGIRMEGRDFTWADRVGARM